MKRGFFSLTLVMTAVAGLLFAPAASALNAREIMQRVDARDDGDNGTATMEMILLDKKGNERRRTLRTFSKDQGDDRYRLMFFMEPADVRGTGFLTYDYDDPGADDDQWLYLPALAKTRRIAAADKSGSFMGSDFNYADMTRKDLDLYTYELLKEITVAERKAWVIQAVPTSPQEIDQSGYTRSLLFVDQATFLVLRAIHWMKEGGGRMKYLDASSHIEQVDGIWVARYMTMTTKQGKTTLHRTILRFKQMGFGQDLDEGLFTVRRLEQGL